jgi:hypothetical protein
VVTASWDKTARVWDLRQTRPSFVALKGHQGPVWSAAFSPDGTQVVTASDDGTALVWDLGVNPPSFVALEGHQGPVVSSAFSPDGTHVVTGSSDKTSRVWRVYPAVNELIAEVRPRLSRCLSQAQRNAYGLHIDARRPLPKLSDNCCHPDAGHRLHSLLSLRDNRG